MADLTNKFFDISTLPEGMGLLWFGISISNIVTKQLAEKCFEYVEIFGNKTHQQRRDNGIGLHMSYTDFLYLYNEGSTAEMKNKYMNLELDHKNGFLNLIKKDKKYSPGFFSFGVRNQLYLDIKGGLHFPALLRDLRKIYDEDTLFQKYALEDLHLFGKADLNENQLWFFLEERLMMYLIAKGMISFQQNDYIKDRQDRTLICYPGPILKWQVYLLQKNFFGFDNAKNKYQNCFYNLDKRVLYDASRIDLETCNYE